MFGKPLVGGAGLGVLPFVYVGFEIGYASVGFLLCVIVAVHIPVYGLGIEKPAVEVGAVYREPLALYGSFECPPLEDVGLNYR